MVGSPHGLVLCLVNLLLGGGRGCLSIGESQNGSALGWMDAYPVMDHIRQRWDETWAQDDRSPRDDHVGASCQILTPGNPPPPIQSAPSTYLAGHMLSHVWAPLSRQVGPPLLVKTLAEFPFILCGTFTVRNVPHILYFQGHYVYGQGHSVSPTNQSR